MSATTSLGSRHRRQGASVEGRDARRAGDGAEAGAVMRWIYVAILGLGSGYIAVTFHWPTPVGPIATIMTLVLAFYVSRVIEDDRKS